MEYLEMTMKHEYASLNHTCSCLSKKTYIGKEIGVAPLSPNPLKKEAECNGSH